MVSCGLETGRRLQFKLPRQRRQALQTCQCQNEKKKSVGETPALTPALSRRTSASQQETEKRRKRQGRRRPRSRLIGIPHERSRAIHSAASDDNAGDGGNSFVWSAELPVPAG